MRMEAPREWAQLDAQQLRDLTATLLERVQQQETQLTEQQTQLIRRDEELKRRQLKIDQLTHEIATLNYLLAKTYAEAGRKTEALLYLRKAISEGFNDRKKLLEDKEFASLRDVPEFQQLIADKRE